MPIAQLASGDQPWVVLVTSLALLVFAVGLNIYIARKQCTTARWRYVFIAKAVASLIAFVGQLVTVIVLLRAMRGDRREELSRDWAHWSGVILELGTTAMMFHVGRDIHWPDGEPILTLRPGVAGASAAKFCQTAQGFRKAACFFGTKWPGNRP